jgi:uncharacterized protein YcfJ
MNKSMIIGVLAGVGIAVAGGVAGFTLMGQSTAGEEQPGAQADLAPVEEAVIAQPAAAAQPRMQSAPTQTTAAARSAPAPTTAPAAVAEPECWEEEVEVQAEPRDRKAIAGTAAGALIGGALADRLGDDDDLVTAAGAAAGAFIGRKAQREFQENRTTTTTVTRCTQ